MLPISLANFVFARAKNNYLKTNWAHNESISPITPKLFRAHLMIINEKCFALVAIQTVLADWKYLCAHVS